MCVCVLRCGKTAIPVRGREEGEGIEGVIFLFFFLRQLLRLLLLLLYILVNYVIFYGTTPTLRMISRFTLFIFLLNLLIYAYALLLLLLLIKLVRWLFMVVVVMGK